MEELYTICRCGQRAKFNGRIVNGKFTSSGSVCVVIEVPYCAVFAILLADQRLAPETVLKLIAAASPENQNVGEVRSLKNRMSKKVGQ